ncbi:MAG: RNA polymerase sigma factor [Chitinophagaceae bacterium]|nr:RNA polymerase sigma factor [Chitinophagaceae bacterium]
MLSLKNQTDEVLFGLIEKNDVKATAELLNRYKGKFYTAIFLLIKDKYITQDIFQDACIKIIHCIRTGKYTEDGKFLPWAMRVARNLAIDHIRQAKRMPKVVLPDGNDIFSVINFKEKSIEDTTMQKQSRNRIRLMLDLIPYEQREVIVMRLYGDLSFKQIAELTEVSVNTALGRMRYGLLSLRKIADERGILL